MLMDTDSAFDESTSGDDGGMNTTQLLLVLCNSNIISTSSAGSGLQLKIKFFSERFNN